MATLKDLARDLRSMAKALETDIPRRANKRIGEGAKIIARAYSAGAVKSIVLQTPLGVTHNESFTGKLTKLNQKKHGGTRGLGAPYGHGSTGWLGPRGPIPYGDPAWINRQTGLFWRSWRLRPATRRDGTPILILQNDAPYAKFLETGTSKAIARPIDKPVRDYIARVGPAIFKEEFDRAWTVRFDTK